MFNPNFKITNKIAQFLAEIEHARGFLEAAKLADNWIKRMQNRALILEAHHTTHIEGTGLTLKEAELLLAGEKLESVTPDDSKELLNYKYAFEFISDYLNTRAPMTEGLIREIHKKLVNNVRGNSAAPGEYRKIQNYVVDSKNNETIYIPPPSYEVPIMMTDLIKWINTEQDINVVLISGIAQFQLVHIHPFLDGNGRTARLLSMLLLYRSGYDFKRLFSLSEFYDRDKSLYYKAIQSVRTQDLDMTVWLEYFCEGLAIQLAEVKEEGTIAVRRDIIVKQYNLSERQSIAIDFILKKGSLTIQDYETLCPMVTKRTLQRELKLLIEKDVFVTEGSTHNLIYKLLKWII
ncbi:MAG: Fic family protein [Coxiellaceae bacterium]|jgi:Fic family protein|nr:Fic family protein [Coxiellaceae bacterium]